MVDFTSDREKLHTAIGALSVGQGISTTAMQQIICPPMSYYEADLIYNMHNTQATTWPSLTPSRARAISVTLC